MTQLDSHVAAVQRKLAFRVFVEWLSMAAFVLAALALLTILLQKIVHVPLPPMLLWIGLGGTVLAAGVMAAIRSPRKHEAAVAIDEKLALKEKFSTALHVRNMKDPFARAVVRDAETTAKTVRLSGQFPLSFPRIGIYAVGLAILAALALRYLPELDLTGHERKMQAQREQEIKIGQSKQILKEAIAKIETMPKAMQDNEQIRIVKKDLEAALQKPAADPAAAARRAVEALSQVDEAMKNKVQETQRFAQTEKSLMSTLAPPIDQKGPVAEAHRQLAEGKFEEAIRTMKDAVEKYEKMPEPDKKQAQQQMQNLANQLQQMARDPRAMQKLQNQLQQMGANQQQIQQLQQAMQQAAAGNQQAQQQAKQMQQQLAQQMAQAGFNQQQIQQMQQACQQAQQNAAAQCQAGQMAQAAGQMAQAIQQAQRGGQNNQGMASAQQQMQDMLQQMQAIKDDADAMKQAQQQMQDAMAQAGGQCNNGGEGQAQNGGKGEWEQGDPQNQGNGQGGPGIGMGGGGDKSPAPFATKMEHSKSYYDPKGQHLASVLIKDRSIKGEAKLKLDEIMNAGAAAAGDDIDDSRANQRTQEVQKKYFSRMAEAAGAK